MSKLGIIYPIFFRGEKKTLKKYLKPRRPSDAMHVFVFQIPPPLQCLTPGGHGYETPGVLFLQIV